MLFCVISRNSAGGGEVNYVKLVEARPLLSATNCIGKRIYLDSMAMLSDIAARSNARSSIIHSAAKIRHVKHCAAISAIAEFLLFQKALI